MDDLDIVEYLRKNAVFNYRDTYIEAANEIERLRKERDEAMALIENIANEVNVLSTRPAAIIKFSDLVDQINEWGDAARKILGSKEQGWDCFDDKEDADANNDEFRRTHR